MKAKSLLSLLVISCTACHTLRTGDLLFHVATEGNAITDVTPSMMDHVAIYAGNGQVIEAIPRHGVTFTPLDSLLQRDNGYYVAGYVKGCSRRHFVAHAREYIGLPYDSLYLPTAEAIYCSELVQLSCVDRRGNRILGTIPMSFHDSTGLVTPYWRQFYSHYGMDVPEGMPGSNPGELSARPQIHIKSTIKKTKKNSR